MTDFNKILNIKQIRIVLFVISTKNEEKSLTKEQISQSLLSFEMTALIIRHQLIMPI